MMQHLRQLVQNLGLAAFALLLSLGLAEMLLRTVYPRYQYAAESAYGADDLRIFSNKPNARYIRPHPDNGSRHNVIYNNQALRLHRDIDASAIGERRIIAVFGDSFTENPRLPVHRVFTEQLDYLLNLAGPHVEVLNFGVDGYGPDQELEYFRTSPLAQRAAQVLYVFCSNDLRNVVENGLFRRAANGSLERNAVQASGALLRLASRLHLTYLALEVRAILLARQGGDSRPAAMTARDLAENAQFRARGERLAAGGATAAHEIEQRFMAGDWAAIAEPLALFRAIVATFANEVTARGAAFSAVLLPREEEHAARPLFDAVPEVIDLYDAFRAADPSYQFAPLRFRNDGHWNEAGNRRAAIALYKHLAPGLGLTVMEDAAILAALERYDAAFEGAGDAASQALRARYTPLDERYGPIP